MQLDTNILAAIITVLGAVVIAIVPFILNLFFSKGKTLAALESQAKNNDAIWNTINEIRQHRQFNQNETAKLERTILEQLQSINGVLMEVKTVLDANSKTVNIQEEKIARLEEKVTILETKSNGKV